MYLIQGEHKRDINEGCQWLARACNREYSNAEMLITNMIRGEKTKILN